MFNRILVKLASQQAELRAEALMAELLERGIDSDGITTRRLGGFKQRYRLDVERFIQSETPFAQTPTFVLELNRDSMYDKLPEGLFHQTRGSGFNSSLENMVAEHKQYKEEERYARRFFAPFEHTFLLYSTEVELEERRLIQSMLNGQFSETFFQFWDIDAAIPKHMASVLIQLIPWVAQIAGHAEATRKSLALMTGRRVELTESIREVQTLPRNQWHSGQAQLGLDTVCGSQHNEPSLQWCFTVYTESEEEMDLFLHAPGYRKFLERVEAFFIPLETDVIFNFEQSQPLQSASFLGYDFYI